MKTMLLALLVVVLAIIILDRVSVGGEQPDPRLQATTNQAYAAGLRDGYMHLVALCKMNQGFSINGEWYSCSRNLSL